MTVLVLVVLVVVLVSLSLSPYTYIYIYILNHIEPLWLPHDPHWQVAFEKWKALLFHPALRCVGTSVAGATAGRPSELRAESPDRDLIGVEVGGVGEDRMVFLIILGLFD